jgi:uncharacterized membrane protein
MSLLFQRFEPFEPGSRDRGRHEIREEVEIEAPLAEVFECWNRYEELAGRTEAVRRASRIGGGRVLWDVDVLGRQLVWEARVVAWEPPKLVRWESTWGVVHSGEARFEPRDGGGTRLQIHISYRPRGLLERLGARLGVVDTQVRRDLNLFRRSVERGGGHRSRRGTGPARRTARNLETELHGARTMHASHGRTSHLARVSL